MKPGILQKQLADAALRAQIDDEGEWRSDNAQFAEHLNSMFPPPSTTAGSPWCIAFWRAVKGLGAEVVQEPQPDPSLPGAIH
jgi:hypothetical protein